MNSGSELQYVRYARKSTCAFLITETHERALRRQHKTWVLSSTVWVLSKAEIVTAIKPTLSGQRILVVGDESHAPQYRQLVEALGGVFFFVPGFHKDHSLHSRLQGADAVVFVTAYASHLKFYATKARLDNWPMSLVNQAGLAAFGRGLDELRERLTRTERKVL